MAARVSGSSVLAQVQECDMEPLRSVVLSVRDRDVVPEESWVYIWIRALTKSVIYVGATGLHPSLRTWLHLNHANPEVGRVTKRFTDAGGDITEEFFVVGYAIPPHSSRADVRDAVVVALSSTSVLDANYVGDGPRLLEQSADADEFAASAVADLLNRLN